MALQGGSGSPVGQDASWLTETTTKSTAWTLALLEYRTLNIHIDKVGQPPESEAIPGTLSVAQGRGPDTIMARSRAEHHNPHDDDVRVGSIDDNDFYGFSAIDHCTC
ncbi:hypothetical protein Moror_17755 [Moniliophthora roreri MCA 2997]|uniref:Uncharacterized protein n=1 Tax=Moniliophthora roreri (strain MCA 2997) TaxID=1381753 RepID=V2Z038_MONRO|nr:hypothetical protein Moror_17755 [Moniliophthora roreri MCA 2997]